MNVEKKHNSNSEYRTDKNGKLFKAEPIEGTPFVLIEMEGKYHARIGKWAITDHYDDKAELLKAVENPNWNMLVAVMHVVSMEAKEILNVLTKEETENSQI